MAILGTPGTSLEQTPFLLQSWLVFNMCKKEEHLLLVTVTSAFTCNYVLRITESSRVTEIAMSCISVTEKDCREVSHKHSRVSI